MLRNFYEDLKSIWLFVDIGEGFIVVFEGFVLVLGKFLHSSVPFFFDVVKGSIDFSFDLSLFTGVVVLLLSLSLIFCDLSAGRGRRGG